MTNEQVKLKVLEICRELNITDTREIMNAHILFNEGVIAKIEENIAELTANNPKKDTVKVSECCGAIIPIDGLDYDICPECKEHCEFVDEEDQ